VWAEAGQQQQQQLQQREMLNLLADSKYMRELANVVDLFIHYMSLRRLAMALVL
jgi:hypothetical protein